MPGFNIGGNGGGADNTRETSRRHRYLIKVFNPLTTDLLFYARKVSIPQVEIDSITIHHKQEQIALPGKHRFLECEVYFYRAHDTNGDKAARELYDWWSKSVINQNESRIATDANGGFQKRTCEIHALDGFGNPAYKYHLYGIWPKKISPDPFDFSESSIAEISVTLHVDKMVEETGRSPSIANIDSCLDTLSGFITGE